MHFLKNIISVLYSLIYFFILKILVIKNFNYHFLQRFSPGARISFYKNGKVYLGKAVRAHSGVKLRVMGNGILKIGSNTAINYGCIISCMGKITIGQGVEFGPNVLVYDHDHDVRAPKGLKQGLYNLGSVEIGENTWIGANSVILKDTKIGDNCVIAAGSLVRGIIPDNTIFVQKRKSELIPIVKDEK